MPYYVYKCLVCKEQLEVVQKITDENLKFCGNYCKEPYSESTGPLNGPVQRILQPTVTIFKGSGFYENDYKKKR